MENQNKNLVMLLFIIIGITAVVSFQGDDPFSSYQSSTCQMAHPRFAVIDCFIGSALSDSGTLTDWEADDSHWVNTEWTNKNPRSKIIAYDAVCSSSYRLRMYVNDEYQPYWNNVNYDLVQGQTVNIKMRCENKYLPLLYQTPGSPEVTYQFTPSYLRFSSPMTSVPVKIQGTDLCTSQSLKTHIRNTAALGSTAEQKLSEADIRTGELPNSEWTTEGHVIRDEIVGDIDESIFFDNQGEWIAYLWDYEEVANIPTFYYQGQQALCDHVSNTIWTYSTLTSSDGTCYKVPGPTITISDPMFGCSNAWCEKMVGVGYALDQDTATCKLADEVQPTTCSFKGDPICGYPPVICTTSDSGLITQKLRFCDTSTMTCSSATQDRQVCCEGDRKGDLCCITDQWKDCQTNILPCPPGMCCTEESTYSASGSLADEYSCKDYGTDHKCCLNEGASLGVCAVECDPSTPAFDFSAIFESIGNSIGKLFGLDFAGAKDALYFGLIVVAAILLFFVVISKRAGPPGTIYGRRMMPQRFANQAAYMTPGFGRPGSWGGGGLL